MTESTLRAKELSHVLLTNYRYIVRVLGFSLEEPTVQPAVAALERTMTHLVQTKHATDKGTIENPSVTYEFLNKVCCLCHMPFICIFHVHAFV